MAKKKGKKGKGKGKGKKGTKTGGLSHQEREIFLLTISELQQKIKWRDHLCEIIEEDLKQYREAHALQVKDKEEAVSLLEQAIQRQRQVSDRCKRAIPDAESSKVQAEKRRARELASKLVQVNEEKISYDAELEALRKKLKSLESYSADKVDEKIQDIERQVQTDDEDAFLKGLEQDKRREEAFKKEMQDILTREAESFQGEISGKLDKNFERITEETRWWADEANVLKIATKRLRSLNEEKSWELRASQKTFKEKKEMSLQASRCLQEKKAQISDLIRQNIELEESKENDARFQGHLTVLDDIAENLKQNMDLQRDHWVESFARIKENETEIKELEETLEAETSFGCELSNFIERAQEILTQEVKQPLILTYDGPPEEKKTLTELTALFEKATKLIYERENKSVL